MPQSGDSDSLSAGTTSRAVRMRAAISSGVSTLSRPRSSTPITTPRGASSASTWGSRPGWAVSTATKSTGASDSSAKNG